MFVLFQVIVLLAAIIVGAIFGGLFGASGGASEDAAGVFGIVTLVLVGIIWLAILIPTIAVMVRRFHDQDKSGWFVLLQFIPYIGGIVLFVFMCIDGTPGPNRYGEDPKARGHRDIFA